MQEQVVKAVMENSSDIFSDLPQYAALITASVAILLFLTKEVLELKRKKKEREQNKYAIDRVASIQGLRIIEQLLFIVKLSNTFKLATEMTDIQLKTDHLSNVRRIVIKSNADLSIPAPLEKFNYEILLLAAKAGDEKFAIFANMNDMNSHLNYIINIVIKKIENGEFERVSNELKDRDGLRKMVDIYLKTLKPLTALMNKNKGYKNIMDELDKELEIL
ncbi:hypothetical protein [Proteus mirabilis]|uniref:hypothetical protein n=1 Tax=Proteus mirabilis TaxID=584 RepID=UPI0018C4559A|nr:hypothetical protein [Proteus mirabilis]MBG2865008.1 hypothetical protein [Proteus mirabilis]MCL8626218.1 hypothetical protein [Proteus mirabilis]MCL8633390.1 hypothetical protein [Proteus mirabilis]MDC9758994.1 hypothetical protein [Proteus mirabilis]MDF7121224.1 hypothetical protein [Proteus mirabilis]